jgi:hypothetical protein
MFLQCIFFIARQRRLKVKVREFIDAARPEIARTKVCRSAFP